MILLWEVGLDVFGRVNVESVKKIFFKLGGVCGLKEVRLNLVVKELFVLLLFLERRLGLVVDGRIFFVVGMKIVVFVKWFNFNLVVGFFWLKILIIFFFL